VRQGDPRWADAYGGAAKASQGGDLWPDVQASQQRGRQQTGGDDWQPPDDALAQPSSPQAEPQPQKGTVAEAGQTAAGTRNSPWINPAAYVDASLWGSAPAAGSNPTPPPPARDNRTVINNYFVNSGSGTMNVNFGGGVAQENSASYQPGAEARKPSPNASAPHDWTDADWREYEERDISIPALPRLLQGRWRCLRHPGQQCSPKRRTASAGACRRSTRVMRPIRPGRWQTMRRQNPRPISRQARNPNVAAGDGDDAF
jgi:hypothetical protein